MNIYCKNHANHLKARWVCAFLTLLMASVLFQKEVLGSESRVALVIGNGDYEASPLRNASNDANDVARILHEKLGFETDVQMNLSLRQMDAASDRFRQRSEEADIRLFYYAGHGLSHQSANYLLPIGATVKSAGDLFYEAYDINRVISKMSFPGGGINILILDSCRNNSVTDSLSSTNAGFFQLPGGVNTYVFYGAKVGTSASDGDGDNGTFTKHLLRFIAEPGLNLNEVANKVRNAVLDETDSKQIPWSESGLKKDVYLAGKEKEFDFLAQASNIEAVRVKLCETKDSKTGRGYKHKADMMYAGEYEFEGRPDHRASWDNYMKAVGACDVTALMALSEITFQHGRCTTAIEYAKLASVFGHRSAKRKVEQINSLLKSNRLSVCEAGM